MLALTRAHSVDRIAPTPSSRRIERTAWRASLLLDGDEFTSSETAIDLLPDLLDAGLAERSVQGVAQNRPFVHNGFALQIAIAREGDGRPLGIRRLMLVLNSIGATVLRGFNNVGRLVTETIGEIVMAPLHLFMRHIQLGLPRVVRRERVAFAGDRLVAARAAAPEPGRRPIAKAISTPERPLDFDAGFSINGWLAVLLTFLLARVFAEGTRIRDDLEGTV